MTTDTAVEVKEGAMDPGKSTEGAVSFLSYIQHRVGQLICQDLQIENLSSTVKLFVA